MCFGFLTNLSFISQMHGWTRETNSLNSANLPRSLAFVSPVKRIFSEQGTQKVLLASSCAFFFGKQWFSPWSPPIAAYPVSFLLLRHENWPYLEQINPAVLSMSWLPRYGSQVFWFSPFLNNGYCRYPKVLEINSSKLSLVFYLLLNFILFNPLRWC